MSKFLRLIIGGIVTLGLAMSLLVATPQPAKAVEREIYTTATEMKFVRLGARARIDAMNNTGTVLNHAKLLPIFTTANVGSYSTAISWRRQFAAGAKHAGARITNATSNELVAIENTRRQFFGGSCSVCKITKEEAARQAQRIACTNRKGQSRHVKYSTGKWGWSHWYDSCETNALISGWTSCGALSAFAAVLIALKSGQAAAVPSIMTLICGARLQEITTAQNNSNLRAVILYKGRQRTDVRGGTYTISAYNPQ